jgi:hypothetical protein
MGIYACAVCGNPHGWFSGTGRDIHDCPGPPRRQWPQRPEYPAQLDWSEVDDAAGVKETKMADKLPRELMESYLAQAHEATFDGFDKSVQREIFNGPHRRLFETVYRMGFECGWRIREEAPAAGAEGLKR